MNYVAAGAALLVFALVFRMSGISDATRNSVSCSKEAIAILRSPYLTVEAKESRMQTASLNLFGHFFSITWRAATVFGISGLPVAAFHLLGLADYTASAAALASWPLLAGGIAAIGLANFRR